MKAIEAETDEFYLVLRKFINLCIFGKIKNPIFGKKGSVRIHKNLLEFYAILENEKPDNQKEIVSKFYQKLAVKFYKALDNYDYFDLMNCYGFSHFRTLMNLMKMLNGPDKKMELFDPKERDFEILSEMILQEKFPEEIESYLYMQFFDIFQHIPISSTDISKEQYQFLIDRYVIKYDYDKVLNIVYRNYDEIPS